MYSGPTTNTRTPNAGTQKFEADPINSTYRWELYLTPGQPGNKVALMDGYSKGFGYENTNKVDLLYKKLINPLLPYLFKCDCIVIYEQRAGLPKNLHPVLIELYPRDFQVYSWVRETAPIVSFLNTYYAEYIRTGTMPPIEDRRKNARQAFLNPELDHSKYDFRTADELKDFCSRHVQKYSARCMETWYFKHAEFQPELFENAPQMIDALNHAKNTAQTQEAAQAAQSSLNSMLNNSKFKSTR